MYRELNEDIAKITINPEKRQIVDIQLLEENLRFKCKRCATFCCKLGGPSLTREDVERIESSGLDIDNFIERVGKQYGRLVFVSTIKNMKDGSCIFLRKSEEKNIYECHIYNVRPFLCRLYPFETVKLSDGSFLLKFIPCCQGLNNKDGEPITKNFIEKRLLETIYPVL